MAGGKGTDPVHYGSGDYGATLDAHDRSKNNAQGLNGYTIDIRPDGQWPGTDAANGTVQFDVQKMQTVVSTLQELHELVQSVPTQLPPSNISYGPAAWAEAAQLQEAGRVITEAVNNYSRTLIDNLAAAKRDIGDSAARNQQAEDAAHRAVNRPGSNLGGGA